MTNWESLIAERSRPAATLAEIDREKTPRRKAYHKKWAHSEAGKESARRRGKKYRNTEHGRMMVNAKSRRHYARKRLDPEFREKRRLYNRDYRARKRAEAKQTKELTQTNQG